MYACGISHLLEDESAKCPPECPFWAPSAIWKYVGVCSKAENCNLYNPVLHYADQNNNVCLPCQTFGCISCKYEDVSDSIAQIADNPLKLPEYCIKCAKGYKRSDDGKMCYLIHASWWSSLFNVLCVLIITYLLVLLIRLLIRRRKLKEVYLNVVDGLENRDKKMLRNEEATGSPLYNLTIDLSKENVSGIGLMLYFRYLKFIILVMSFLFIISMTQTHIPCSEMIRKFNEPFEIEFLFKPKVAPKNLISVLFGKNVTTGLSEHIINFKSVDDAIEWNLAKYSREISHVMYLSYFVIMGITIVYMVSQRRIIDLFYKNNMQWKHLTLIVKGLSQSIADEEYVKNAIYDATNVKVHSVTICYDIREYKEQIDEFLNFANQLKSSDRESQYVNIGKLQGYYEIMENLRGAGQALITFENYNDKFNVLNSFRHRNIKLYEFNVDPDKVIWENIGYEEKVKEKMGLTVITVILILVIWSVTFFVPYAAYSMHTTMSHLVEILLLSSFVELGSGLVSMSLNYAVHRFNIVNRDVIDGYIMCSNYFIKVINLALNIILAHLNNYGGRNKVLTIVNNGLRLSTPSFKMGEEVSFSLTLSVYMINSLVIIPNVLFIFGCYIMPTLKLLVAFLFMYDHEQACNVLEYPTIDLANKYASDLVNFTSCLLLLFMVKGKQQGVVTFLALFVSYILNYLRSQFILLRRSSKSEHNTWSVECFSLIIWAFPTAIFAACPQYWKWRSSESTLSSIIWSVLSHLAIYYSLMYIIFFPFISVDVNTTHGIFVEKISRELYKENNFEITNVKQPHYKFYNPVYKFREFKTNYNL
ncbi:conserved hypothetical protein [Theileria equi strain WA]|uniref:CSC1/OSCA1-like 7TM region domain-containing protein n=1 Tax=Theileria equi strain WA TaxID=1537102 RepID=L1LBV0_THEEQ|nr:conserved hypothetical protein [Theileria equi strain WA]EKX72917.1 conserved hypothetical protein [Theileria equi strain WA]|eukprot:XP_004832369.1 conserved hypothetical protein [Theileria equi strain WA]